MPRRTNWFQRLVKVVEQNLASDDAEVIESALLLDRITGSEREVDILIRSQSGPHEVTLGVECVGGETRPADVTWVEKIAGKHRDLPIDRSILVSKTGFSKNAIAKAAILRMETLTLSDALNTDWRAELYMWPASLEVKTPKLLETQVLLTVFDEESQCRLRSLTGSPLEDRHIYTNAGVQVGTFQEIVNRALNHDEVKKHWGEMPVPGVESVYALPVEYVDLEGSYVLTDEGEKIIFSGIKIIGFMTYEVTDVPWKLGSYGDAAVSYASFPFEEKTVTVVATERRGKAPVARIFLDREADRELKFTLETRAKENDPRDPGKDPIE